MFRLVFIQVFYKFIKTMQCTKAPEVAMNQLREVRQLHKNGYFLFKSF